jgi:hypothetical protein
MRGTPQSETINDSLLWKRVSKNYTAMNSDNNSNNKEKKLVLELHQDSNDPFQSWPGLYALTEHWQSDVKFFQDELRFINTLVDRYLLKLIEEDTFSRIEPLALALLRLEKRSNDLEDRITIHLEHIRELLESPFSHDSQTYKDEHLTLENDLMDFVKDFRFAKGEIFKSTEQVLKTDKSKHLLEP